MLALLLDRDRKINLKVNCVSLLRKETAAEAPPFANVPEASLNDGTSPIAWVLLTWKPRGSGLEEVYAYFTLSNKLVYCFCISWVGAWSGFPGAPPQPKVECTSPDTLLNFLRCFLRGRCH